jgi:hypothetical protein
MKTSKEKTMIIILQVTSEFVWKNECFLRRERKKMQMLYKKFKWHINISVMMLLCCHNWKITAAKQV